MTLNHFHQFQLSGIIFQQGGAASFAWSQRSAELPLKISERSPAQQRPPDGLPLHQSGFHFRIRRHIQELSDIFHALT